MVAMEIPKFDRGTCLKVMKEVFKYKFQSANFDNGSEFTQMSELENKGGLIYFAHAYA